MSVDDAVGCVSASWSEKPLHLTVVPLSGGTSIRLRDGTDATMVALVDIVATGATTTAKHYSKSGEDSRYSEQVMDCMHTTTSIQ